MPMSASVAGDARKVLVVVFFLGCFILSSQRINFSIAILNMVNETGSFHICPVTNETSIHSAVGDFEWTPSMQAHVLASYFYGLVFTRLPSELLADRFSAHYIALFGMAVSSVSTYFTPHAARFHYACVILVQILKAAGHSLVMPAFSVMLGNWVPTKRLIRFMSYATSGISTGAFFTLLLGGLICILPDYGWPYVFYIPGIMGFIWCVIWLYLCMDNNFLPGLSSSRRQADFLKTDLAVPYVQILKSKPFWGYVCAGVTTYWMIALNILVQPTYIHVVFGLPSEWNGLVSSYPSVLQAFVYLLSITILKRRTPDKTSVRRGVACFGMSIFATCTVLLTFVKCRKPLGILLMVLAIGASGFNIAALAVIPTDMSPNFAGVLSGIMNTIGSAAACGLPLMVGYLMEKQRTLVNWSKIYYACFFVSFINMILFMAYSSCEVQEWNNPPEKPAFSYEDHLGPIGKPSTVEDFLPDRRKS